MKYPNKTLDIVPITEAISIEQSLVLPKRPPREILRTTPRRAHNVIKSHQKLWTTRWSIAFAWLPTRVAIKDRAESVVIWFEKYDVVKAYYIPKKTSEWKTMKFKRS